MMRRNWGRFFPTPPSPAGPSVVSRGPGLVRWLLATGFVCLMTGSALVYKVRHPEPMPGPAEPKPTEEQLCEYMEEPKPIGDDSNLPPGGDPTPLPPATVVPIRTTAPRAVLEPPEPVEVVHTVSASPQPEMPILLQGLLRQQTSPDGSTIYVLVGAAGVPLCGAEGTSDVSLAKHVGRKVTLKGLTLRGESTLMTLQVSEVIEEPTWEPVVTPGQAVGVVGSASSGMAALLPVVPKMSASPETTTTQEPPHATMTEVVAAPPETATAHHNEGTATPPPPHPAETLPPVNVSAPLPLTPVAAPQPAPPAPPTMLPAPEPIASAAPPPSAPQPASCPDPDNKAQIASAAPPPSAPQPSASEPEKAPTPPVTTEPPTPTAPPVAPSPVPPVAPAPVPPVPHNPPVAAAPPPIAPPAPEPPQVPVQPKSERLSPVPSVPATPRPLPDLAPPSPKPPVVEAPTTPVLVTGTHPCTLEMGTVTTVPDVVREQMGKPPVLYVALGPDQKSLWIYTLAGLDRLMERLEKLPGGNDRVQRCQRLCYSRMVKVNVDDAGRTTLPVELVHAAGLGENMVLIGARDHYELWDSARWEKYCEQPAPEATRP